MKVKKQTKPFRGAQSSGIPLKKQYGQHFLRDQAVVDCMLSSVTLDNNSSVFEIGCGDGFLTSSLISKPLKRLWVFEIDPEWAAYVANELPDPRLSIFQEDILAVDFSRFEPDQPWTLLSNLPYQITFPLLRLLKQHRSLLCEGVIMVQEEVAQKITATAGESTHQSIYYSYYFEWKLLCAIAPEAFYPPPLVHSRLLYFKPKTNLVAIPHEDAFWRFIKIAFRQRRRTLRNNLMQSHYSIALLPAKWQRARAQELSLNDFLELWHVIQPQHAE